MGKTVADFMLERLQAWPALDVILHETRPISSAATTPETGLALIRI